jgi:tetratricopeptide (TPR) repeat protein
MKNLTKILLLSTGISFFSSNVFSQEIKSFSEFGKEHKELIEKTNKLFSESRIGILKGNALLKYYKKDYNGAIQDYLKYLKSQPNDAEAYSLLANCFSAINQPKNAIKYYSKAIKFNPDAYIHYQIANQYVKLNSYEEAHQNLDKAIVINPKEKVYYEQKHRLYKKQKELKKSKEILEKGLRKNPGSKELNFFFKEADYDLKRKEVFLRAEAIKNIEDGNYMKAIEIYNNLIKILPDNEELYLSRGHFKSKLTTILNPFKMFKYSFSALKDFKKVKNIANFNTKTYKHAEFFEKNTKKDLLAGSMLYGIFIAGLTGLSFLAFGKKKN